MASKINQNQMSMLTEPPALYDDGILHSPTIIALPEAASHVPSVSLTNEQQLEVAASALEIERLTAYQGLLKVFGKMNASQNFQNRFSDAPWIANRVSTRLGAATPNERLEQSRDKTERYGARGLKLVGQMLGTAAMVEAGVVTEKQATALAETTYEHYKKAYQGMDPQTKKARESQVGKVNRRLKKLQGSK